MFNFFSIFIKEDTTYFHQGVSFSLRARSVYDTRLYNVTFDARAV